MIAILQAPSRRNSLSEKQPQLDSAQPISTGSYIVYAIAFDLDTEMLKNHYGNDSYNNAYGDIRKLLTTKHNFKWQQGSVYFGDREKVNAVTCVLAAMDV